MATTDPRHLLGARAEEVVADHLTAQGWTTVARNWRCRQGEIDLIATRGEVLAFIEVRAHSRSAAMVSPERSVTTAKQRRLEMAARWWLTRHPQRRKILRFDVVGVVMKPGCSPALRHYPNAFEACDF